MKAQCCAALAFHGNAREAMEFYQSVFGGELGISTFADFGAVPPGDPGADHIMHAQLDAADLTLMASDLPPGMPHTPGETVSLVLWGDDEAKLRGWYEALSEGGEVSMPLERQIWGDLYGDFRDRFGISWSVNISTPGEG
ncbi:MAG: VOC family protein [Actinobacteria bacterium]|nr:VOC family protein [Actinomycetota bacterium]